MSDRDDDRDDGLDDPAVAEAVSVAQDAAAAQRAAEAGFRPRADVVADEVLGRIDAAGYLVPGAAAELRKRMSAQRGGASQSVGELFAALLTEGGRRYLDPDRKRDDASPLRQILRMLPLRDEKSREALWTRFAMDANRLADITGRVAAERQAAAEVGGPFDEAKATARARYEAVRDLAALVVDYLESAEGRRHWFGSVRPQPTHAERVTRRLLDGLDRLGYISPSVDLDILAHKFARVAALPTKQALRELMGGIGMEPGATGPTPRSEFDAGDVANWLDGAPSSIGAPAQRPAGGTPPRRPRHGGASGPSVSAEAVARAADQLRQSGRYTRL